MRVRTTYSTPQLACNFHRPYAAMRLPSNLPASEGPSMQVMRRVQLVISNLSVNTDVHGRSLPSVAPFRGRRLRLRYTAHMRRIPLLH
jgi:hypothetical protein